MGKELSEELRRLSSQSWDKYSRERTIIEKLEPMILSARELWRSADAWEVELCEACDYMPADDVAQLGDDIVCALVAELAKAKGIEVAT